MRYLALVTSLSGLVLASPCGGQSFTAGSDPMSLTLCMKPDGSTFSPQCKYRRHMAATCDCAGRSHVSLPICVFGETAAPQTVEGLKARYAAAAHGDVLTARYEGKRFCVGSRPVSRGSRYAGSGNEGPALPTTVGGSSPDLWPGATPTH